MFVNVYPEYIRYVNMNESLIYVEIHIILTALYLRGSQKLIKTKSIHTNILKTFFFGID